MATFVTKYLRIAGGGAELEQGLRPTGWFSERTAWVGRLTPLRRFVRTETGGAAVLVAAVLAALVWANVGSSYQEVWETPVALTFGDDGIRLSLREWVNSGLMTFFFLVTGLEARRELDLGELRERRRLVLPLLVGVGGMAASVAVYLAFNLGGPSAAGWGIALSSDAALGLGLLAVAAPRAPQRLRAFVLTVLVVNELVALALIAALYSHDLDLTALAWGATFVAMIAAMRALGVRSSIPCVLLGVAAWVALHESGVEPVVLGLALGLLFGARPVGRPELHRATERFRRFREQPTPKLERSARHGLRAAIPPNERLLALFHPWTSYAIVPLFALANAGVAIDGELLRRAAGSPVTIGVLLGFLAGQAARHVRHGARGHPPVARAAPPAGRLGGGHRRGHHHQRRLHRVAAGRLSRVHRSRSRRGQVGPPRGRGAGACPDLDGDTSDKAPAPAAAAQRAARRRRAAGRPRLRRRSDP